MIVDAVQRLARPSLADIALDRCVSYLGFSFGARGWHPLRAVAEEIAASGDGLAYQTSILARFYAQFRPASVADAYRLDADDAPYCAGLSAHAVIHVYPWTQRTLALHSGECQHFGPAPHDGPKHFAHQRGLVASIRDKGFRPPRVLPSGIRGIWLRGEGETRFLLRGGQHRAGVLAALGHATLAARVDGVVDIEHVKTWPLVREGQMRQDEAERVFLQYFALDGRERAPVA